MQLESPDSAAADVEDPKELSDARLRQIYVAVLLNTVAVITLLWWFSKAFL